MTSELGGPRVLLRKVLGLALRQAEIVVPLRVLRQTYLELLVAKVGTVEIVVQDHHNH